MIPTTSSSPPVSAAAQNPPLRMRVTACASTTTPEKMETQPKNNTETNVGRPRGAAAMRLQHALLPEPGKGVGHGMVRRKGWGWNPSSRWALAWLMRQLEKRTSSEYVVKRGRSCLSQ